MNSNDENSSLKSGNKILTLLFAGVLMGALDISIIGPALPSIEQSIKVDERLIGWIFSIYVLFNLVGISLFAKLSDIFGRRKIYVLSVAIFALGSTWVAFSESFNMILIGRAIQGFGASGIFPVATATVGDLFPPEKRGRVLGMIGMVFGLAFIIGPLIAGVLLIYFSWNSLFIINLPISVLVIFGAIKLLPNVRVVNENKFDWRGIIIMAIMLSSFSFGVNQVDSKDVLNSLINPLAFYPLLFSIVVLPLFIFLEKGHEFPVVNVKLFTKRQIRIVGFIAFGTGLIQSSFVFFPEFAVANFNVNNHVASFMLVPVVVATAIGSPVFGRMLDKFGSRSIIMLGIALMVIGFFLLSIFYAKISMFYISGAFIGLGLSVLSGSSLRYIMLNEVAASERALTQGLVTIFISVGQLAGGAIIGALIASGGRINAFVKLFLLLGFSNLVMLVVAFWLKSRKVEFETYRINKK